MDQRFKYIVYILIFFSPESPSPYKANTHCLLRLSLTERKLVPSVSDPAVLPRSTEVRPPPRSSIPSIRSQTLPHNMVPKWVSVLPRQQLLSQSNLSLLIIYTI